MNHGLDVAYNHVRTFHRTFGHPAPSIPTVQSDKRRDDRAGFIESECDELRVATTIVDQADAYLDIIYFALGGLVELGIRPHPLFMIVNQANMNKLWQDGKPRYDPVTNKILKPKGWEAPEPKLAAEVDRQIAVAQKNLELGLIYDQNGDVEGRVQSVADRIV